MAISTATLINVSPDDKLLQTLVESVAAATDRPARPLHLQALLHLPRIANEEGLVDVSDIKELLTGLAQELPSTAEWFVTGLSPSPRQLRFESLILSDTYNVMLRFHYLRSPRIDGRAYALKTDNGRLVTICITSPLDVKTLDEMLIFNCRSPKSARIVSRVFAFEGAPKNSISYMLSRAALEESRLGVTDLLTYVNPNMGFRGSSYRASGWNLLGTEAGTKYRYVDGRYMTDRELAMKYGKTDDTGYKAVLRDRFSVSMMPLQPLLVFWNQIKSRFHQL